MIVEWSDQVETLATCSLIGSTSGILGLGPSRENHILAKSQSIKMILAK